MACEAGLCASRYWKLGFISKLAKRSGLGCSSALYMSYAAEKFEAHALKPMLVTSKRKLRTSGCTVVNFVKTLELGKKKRPRVEAFSIVSVLVRLGNRHRCVVVVVSNGNSSSNAKGDASNTSS